MMRSKYTSTQFGREKRNRCFQNTAPDNNTLRPTSLWIPHMIPTHLKIIVSLILMLSQKYIEWLSLKYTLLLIIQVKFLAESVHFRPKFISMSSRDLSTNIRLLTWNVDGLLGDNMLGERSFLIVKEIGSLDTVKNEHSISLRPHVIQLQEITLGNADIFAYELGKLGKVDSVNILLHFKK